MQTFCTKQTTTKYDWFFFVLNWTSVMFSYALECGMVFIFYYYDRTTLLSLPFSFYAMLCYASFFPFRRYVFQCDCADEKFRFYSFFFIMLWKVSSQFTNQVEDWTMVFICPLLLNVVHFSKVSVLVLIFWVVVTFFLLFT